MKRPTIKRIRQTARQPRARLPVLVSSLALLWTVYSYCQGGAQGLLVLVVLAGVAATALSRSLPPTSRSMIWSYLAAAVLCMAANIGRISLSDGGLGGGDTAYLYDRAATLVLAIGVATLFFRPSRSTVTILGVAILPMLGVMLENAKSTGDTTTAMVSAGVALGLVVLAAQSQQATIPRSPEMAPAGIREWCLRLLVPVVWMSLAVLFTPTVASWAEATRGFLYELAGLNPPSSDGTYRRTTSLSIASPPDGFSGRVRVILEIDADACPGYLRESVYRSYALRQWSGRSAIIRTPKRLPGGFGELKEEGWVSYALGLDDQPETGETWTFRPLGQNRLSSLCLPGAARVVAMPEDVDPLESSDGIVSLDVAPCPASYQVYVDRGVEDSAFPQPDPEGLSEYLEIPSRLAPAASNWVQSCPALVNSSNTVEAVSAVVRYFGENFSYRLGGGAGVREPLETFMKEREGHCTLFASAATLMLRTHGIPTRLVSGYYCGERHQYTGRWVVRERNAHAWCEAWDDASGRWWLVEATPPSGLPEAMPPPGQVRLLQEMIGDAWRRFVERIRESNPLIVLVGALASVFVWVWNVIASPVGLALAAVGIAALIWRLWRRRRGKSHDEAAQLRAEVERTMVRLERRWFPPHLRRREQEPWGIWIRRVEAVLPPDRAEMLRELVEAYQTLRYRTPFDMEQAQAWCEFVRFVFRKNTAGRDLDHEKVAGEFGSRIARICTNGKK